MADACRRCTGRNIYLAAPHCSPVAPRWACDCASAVIRAAERVSIQLTEKAAEMVAAGHGVKLAEFVGEHSTSRL